MKRTLAMVAMATKAMAMAVVSTHYLLGIHPVFTHYSLSDGGDGGDELLQGDELIMSPTKKEKTRRGIKIGLALATGRFEAPLVFDKKGQPELSYKGKPVLALTQVKVGVKVSAAPSSKVNRLEP